MKSALLWSSLQRRSQKSTCTSLRACKFTKKRLQHKCFPVKFVKFLRTLILKNMCERLLLCRSLLFKNLVGCRREHLFKGNCEKNSLWKKVSLAWKRIIKRMIIGKTKLQKNWRFWRKSALKINWKKEQGLVLQRK